MRLILDDPALIHLQFFVKNENILTFTFVYNPFFIVSPWQKVCLLPGHPFFARELPEFPRRYLLEAW